jgi:hypothetical protein
MKRLDMILRVRSLTRDLSNSIFREEDILMYMDEAIDRFKQVLPELEGMDYLVNRDDEPILLPLKYHSLIPLYSASRCFGQDERHYQATSFMNEFEQKLDEFRMKVEAGEELIKDSSGNTIERTYPTSYVVDNYFESNTPEDEEDEVVS